MVFSEVKPGPSIATEAPKTGTLDTTDPLWWTNLLATHQQAMHAMQWQRTRQATKATQAVVDAENKSVYGDAYDPPKDEDVFAVGSEFKHEVHNHYHGAPEAKPCPPRPLPLPPAPTDPKPVPRWRRWVVPALVTLGALTLGAALPSVYRWATTPATATPGPGPTPNPAPLPVYPDPNAYKLDFW